MQFRKKAVPGLLLAQAFICQFVFSDLGTFATPERFTPQVQSGHAVGQTFVSDFSGLTKIGIFIDRNGLGRDGKLVFRLRPGVSSDADIAKLEVNVSDIEDNWRLFRFPPKSDKKSCLYFFQFKPIEDSKGKLYYFSVEYQNIDKDRSIRFGISGNKYDQGFSGGSSYVDGKKQEWYLLFQTYCAWTGTGQEALSEAMKRISGDRQFFTVYFAVCFIILAALVAITIIKKLGRKD